jgi:hypothetical protein
VIVRSSEAAHRFITRGPRSPVVCGVDDSGAAIRAVRLAMGLADRFGVELRPIHIDADGTWQDAPLGMPPATTLASRSTEAIRSKRWAVRRSNPTLA